MVSTDCDYNLPRIIFFSVLHSKLVSKRIELKFKSVEVTEGQAAAPLRCESSLSRPTHRAGSESCLPLPRLLQLKLTSKHERQAGRRGYSKLRPLRAVVTNTRVFRATRALLLEPPIAYIFDRMIVIARIASFPIPAIGNGGRSISKR